MIDRFGNTVNVAWSEHEILWLRAAMMLSRFSRRAALEDIAVETGRGFVATYGKYCALRAADRVMAHKAELREKKRLARELAAAVSSTPSPTIEASKINTSQKVMALRVGARA